jgi:hypothetical protein
MDADVILQLPDGRQSAILTFVDLRINLGPWAEALGAAGQVEHRARDLRITIPDLVEFYVAAWNTATMIAPLGVVEDPLAMSPAGRPRVEFQFEVSPYHHSPSPNLRLEDVFDLSLLGAPTNDLHRREGGFGIVAPLDVPRDQRRTLIEDQLVGLAQAWGFIYADVEKLKSAIR